MKKKWSTYPSCCCDRIIFRSNAIAHLSGQRSGRLRWRGLLGEWWDRYPSYLHFQLAQFHNFYRGIEEKERERMTQELRKEDNSRDWSCENHLASLLHLILRERGQWGQDTLSGHTNFANLLFSISCAISFGVRSKTSVAIVDLAGGVATASNVSFPHVPKNMRKGYGGWWEEGGGPVNERFAISPFCQLHFTLSVPYTATDIPLGIRGSHMLNLGRSSITPLSRLVTRLFTIFRSWPQFQFRSGIHWAYFHCSEQTWIFSILNNWVNKKMLRELILERGEEMRRNIDA